MPANCDYVFVTVAVGTDGMVAAVFVARGKRTGYAATLIDFDVAPLGSATLRGIAERLETLATECRSRNGVMALVPTGMLSQAIATGLNAARDADRVCGRRGTGIRRSNAHRGR